MTTNRVWKKMGVSIMYDTVSIDIICGDEYFANVLYEDLIERLQSGEEITIRLDVKANQTENQER